MTAFLKRFDKEISKLTRGWGALGAAGPGENFIDRFRRRIANALDEIPAHKGRFADCDSGRIAAAVREAYLKLVGEGGRRVRDNKAYGPLYELTKAVFEEFQMKAEADSALKRKRIPR